MRERREKKKGAFYPLQRIRRAFFITPAVLLKLSKHGALLVCLLIVGRGANRYEFSQLLIFGLAVAAALLHSVGRSLQYHVTRGSPRQDKFG